MGTSTREATQTLTTQKNELVKQFTIFDGFNRPNFVYTAPISAIDGSGCTRVEYTYLTPTSTLVEKMAESQDVWSAAYDI